MIRNSRLYCLLMLAVLFSSLMVFTTSTQVRAQDATPTTSTPIPEFNTYTNSAFFTLKDFKQETIVIAYPGAGELYFDLPNRWSIVGDDYSYFEMHYDLDDPSYDFESGWDYDELMPRVDVYINDMFIDSFIPEIGKNHIQKIPLPSALLRFPTINNPNNEYDVRIEFEANWDEYCEYVGILTIHDHSFFQLEFSILPPELNLGRYFNTIAQDSFIPETLYIVLPDNLNEMDLNTAALLIDDISQKTFGDIRMELITASRVTDELLSQASFITIGSPSRNLFTEHLFEQRLVSPWLDGEQNVKYGVPIEDGDGILQVLPNHINTIYGILVITGNSDQGTYHAAEAITNPMLDMVSEFYIVPSELEITRETLQPSTLEVMTFSELGFVERGYFGTGVQSAFLNVYIPRNWEVQEDSRMNLIYAQSSNLSRTNSSLTVYLNGKLIGMAPFDTEVQGDQEIVIPVLPEYLVPGSLNTFRFEMVIAAPIECALLETRAFWSTIRDRSTLSLPYEEITAVEDLPPFVHPLYYLAYDDAPLNVVLPEEPTEADFYALVDMIRYISRLAPVPRQISIIMDPVPISSFSNENLLVLGKPADHPMIWELNELFPQPFVPDSDMLLEKVGTIPYQVPQESDIGIVEVLPSPWNDLNGITLLTGTTDTGYKWAVDMLSSDEFIYTFYGDVFFVYGEKMSGFQSEIPSRDTLDVIVSELTGEQVVLETAIPTVVPSVNQDDVVPIDRYEMPDGSQNVLSKTGDVISKLLLGIILIGGLAAGGYTIQQTVRGGRKNGK